MKWSRLTVNIEPDIAALAKKRAKEQRRSFAAYVATLIELDLAAKAAEGLVRPGGLLAEEPSVYAQPKARPSVDDLAAGEAKRRRKPAANHGGGSRGGTKV